MEELNNIAEQIKEYIQYGPTIELYEVNESNTKPGFIIVTKSGKRILVSLIEV